MSTTAPPSPEDTIAQAETRIAELGATRTTQAQRVAELGAEIEAAVLDGKATDRLHTARRQAEDGLSDTDRALSTLGSRVEQARGEIIARDRRRKLDDAREQLAARKADVAEHDAATPDVLAEQVAAVVDALDAIAARAEQRQELCRQIEVHAKMIADTAQACGEQAETVYDAGHVGGVPQIKVMSAHQLLTHKAPQLHDELHGRILGAAGQPLDHTTAVQRLARTAEQVAEHIRVHGGSSRARNPQQ